MIGIGITTRNRSEVLQWCLLHFQTFKPSKAFTVVVVDDFSNPDEREKNKIICKNQNVEYIFNNERKGIAGAKNVCIGNLKDSDFIFLFDDDCFPKKSDWDLPFLLLAEKGIEHSSYIRGDIHNNKKINKNIEYEVWKNSLGMCLFFTKQCLVSIGLYDENFGMYGYEHADMSIRASEQGFCPKFSIHGYVCPIDAKNYIYSLDCDYELKNELTSLGKFDFVFSSTTKDDPLPEYLLISSRVFGSKYN
jgi:GT2 family glycosyltransferase